jgi:hypothetical protein
VETTLMDRWDLEDIFKHFSFKGLSVPESGSDHNSQRKRQILGRIGGG